jgi:histone H3/H4
MNNIALKKLETILSTEIEPKDRNDCIHELDTVIQKYIEEVISLCIATKHTKTIMKEDVHFAMNRLGYHIPNST